MTKPPRTKPVPIRFDSVLRGRLRQAARRLGSTPSAVVRFAVLQQLPQIERGRIILTAEEYTINPGAKQSWSDETHTT
jgi:predicted transcriptional regulator